MVSSTPSFIECEEFCIMIESTVAAKLWVISIQDYPIPEQQLRKLGEVPTVRLWQRHLSED
jgi:hypothetical protein